MSGAHLPRWLAGIAFATAGLAMGSSSHDPTALFPLEPGQVWDHAVTTEVDGEPARREALTLRSLDAAELAAGPTPDTARRYVLKQPVAAGTQWQAATTAYLLARHADFPPEIRHSHPSIPMRYTIESTTERITTPAGQWSGRVRVKGTATVRLFADPTSGWSGRSR
jgi:hypothetical protein